MSTSRARLRPSTTVVAHNPLEGEQLLLDALYGKPAARVAGGLVTDDEVTTVDRPRPQHYKIISISLYNEDIEHLEKLVGELKRRGHYKANKSQVIREALARLNLDELAVVR